MFSKKEVNRAYELEENSTSIANGRKPSPSNNENTTATLEPAAQSGDLEERGSDEDDIEYPTGVKLALITVSLFVSMFLVSLDRLIISTAIPQITNDFNSAGDIGWYGTAYLLTSCAFQLVFGKIYTVFSIKATFLTSIILFEAGSAICGAAPNSIAFILGRSIAGLGSAGVFAGVMVVIVFAVPLHKRPVYQGSFGGVFGISSIAGPLIGGAFTSNVTWRWCFYINLPLGAVVCVLVLFLLHIPDRPSTHMPFRSKLVQLNAPGLLALLPGIVCLCLALQWGGTTYEWNQWRIILLLVLGIVLLIVFVLIQIWKPDQATVPPKIFAQRSIASGFWIACCAGAHQNLFVYYLPIWFQAIQGVSAVGSGIRLLAMLLPTVIATVVSGILISRIGYYNPFLIFGICLTAIGSGLLTTLKVNTTTGQWIGYQILYGFGFGSSMQVPNMAAQTVLAREKVAIGVSLMFFAQMLLGSVFTSVGQNVLDNQLANRLAGVPGITRQIIVQTGATNLLNIVPTQYHDMVLQAYNESLCVCFQVGLIMACLAILGALTMEWRSVRKNLPAEKPTNGSTVELAEGEDEVAADRSVDDGGGSRVAPSITSNKSNGVPTQGSDQDASTNPTSEISEGKHLEGKEK
ncbi:MFS general substrate transporter [Cryphonectria parasitica EP155]|uniref:MFS general substrate transporter n=1 Tax=Cryphonectria parasitica (strain ATCC 38755 / EP155) TaxID=660469 RepID=A0A9P4XYN7_CRYP1|nr:MFS general substrate transporter [Cryphonectria parasitica EP155]KAF3763197.1 MFS general substrate transporter [Cryphonectria parasitica EP155]